MLKKLSDGDYQALSEFRYEIRRFLRFSERAARGSGLEPRQHQLLLALKGLPPRIRPRIAAVAERLQIQHHSTVELVNRLEAGGYVRRRPGTEDKREVLLELTARGENVLRELSLHHRNELRSQGPKLLVTLERLLKDSHLEVRKR